MITIIYSTHKDEDYNKKFKEHISRSVGLDNIQILEYQNNNEYSLAQVYNKGLAASEFDIVVCCHNDIRLENDWGKKLLNDFDKNPQFGIIGKAGSCYFPKSGIYWEKMNQTMVGQVWHNPEGCKKWLNTYSPKLPFIIPVVTIDGLFIAFNKTKIKHGFDETIGRFHFYDHGFCVPNYLDGVKIGVTSSFEITHKSIGQPNLEFFESKEKFLEKWGEKLPLDLKPETVYFEEIKEKPLKGVGKIAVIIPTKGKVEMLYDCVKSFYDNCNPSLFDIFIADTGSTDDEKEFIRTQIMPLGGVKLIEYDYYNFAKINNDVVKNHVTKEYEFLLFCNNDIKLLNNAIYGMLKVFKEHPKAGTVGARLHYGDGTVQHEGMRFFLTKNNNLIVTHVNLKKYYNHNKGVKEVLGNTGGLMMIRKNLFLKLNGFSEEYFVNLEDVELNINCVLNGFSNYCNSDPVAYHYESQTRDTKDELELIKKDYFNRLKPFIDKHIKRLHKYL